MTDRNFYRTHRGRDFLDVIFPPIAQFGGLMMGFYAVATYISKTPEKTDLDLVMLLSGMAIYFLGKGTAEYAERKYLSQSFTHLEETLREEFKKNKQPPE